MKKNNAEKNIIFFVKMLCAYTKLYYLCRRKKMI